MSSMGKREAQEFPDLPTDVGAGIDIQGQLATNKAETRVKLLAVSQQRTSHSASIETAFHPQQARFLL